jgi:hypothetical protein
LQNQSAIKIANRNVLEHFTGVAKNFCVQHKQLLQYGVLFVKKMPPDEIIIPDILPPSEDDSLCQFR